VNKIAWSAGAVEADIEQVETPVGAGDDGVIDGYTVEVRFVARALEDKLGTFV
jgi:hypothetical protein